MCAGMFAGSAGVNGPLWHIAEFFFFYAGLLGDTVFIRISLIAAQSFMFLWTTVGTPMWPDFQSPSGNVLHIDALIWTSLCVIVAAIPLYRQLTHDDAQVKFCCDSMTDEAEALWRSWFRRSGIPRTDFKVILDAGEWLELAPGCPVPMWELDANDADQASLNAYGNVYYYVVGGTLECKTVYREGERRFTARPGAFVDAFALIALLGQPTAALAMQNGPLEVHVMEDSAYSWTAPPRDETEVSSQGRSPGVAVERSGALLLRLSRRELVRRVMRTPGLALPSLRLIVTQSTLDNLFCESLNPAPRRRYDVIHDVRQRINVAPLPVNAAVPTRRKRSQWWLAHLSLRDFWRPGTEQRAMNAVRLDSREQELEQLHLHQEELEQLRNIVVASPFSTPAGRSQTLAGLVSPLMMPKSSCTPWGSRENLVGSS